MSKNYTFKIVKNYIKLCIVYRDDSIFAEKKLEWPDKIYSTSDLNSNYTSGCLFKNCTSH